MDKQQGLTIYHKKLYSICCDKLYWKRIWKIMCVCVYIYTYIYIIELICYATEINTTL